MLSIQALRGIAALSVILCHCRFFPDGWIGVDLFFCLSGFLIASIHFRDIGNPAKAQPFALKRFIRIYPLLFVFLLGWTGLRLGRGLLGLGWHTDELDGKLFWEGIPPTLFMLPTLYTNQRALFVSWTLAYECLFYAAFWLAILGGKRIAHTLFWGWLALIVGFNLLGGPPHSAWQTPFNTHILEFLCGVAASRLPLRHSAATLAGALLLLTAVGLGGLIQCSTPQAYPLANGFGPFFLASKACLGVAIAALILGCVGLENRGRLPLPPFLLTLGDASYSLYLSHELVIMTVHQFAKWLSLAPFLDRLLGCLISVVTGLLLYRWIEKPMLKAFRTRLLKKAPPVPAS